MRKISLLLLLAASLPAAADTNPRRAVWRPFRWDDCAVGSWIRYRVRYYDAKEQSEWRYTGTLTLEKKTSSNVVVGVRATIDGVAQELPPVTVDRRNPAHPLICREVRNIDRGLETIEAMGKKLRCRLLVHEHVRTDVAWACRVWLHPDVPTGVVRCEMEYGGTGRNSCRIEIDAFRRK